MVHITSALERMSFHLGQVVLVRLTDDQASILVTIILQSITENLILLIEDDASPETFDREADLRASDSVEIAESAIDGSEAVNGGENECKEEDEVALRTMFLAFIPGQMNFMLASTRQCVINFHNERMKYAGRNSS